MKIAVTSQGKELESPVDPRFGRALYLLIVDTDTGAHEVVDNKQNLSALQGAGIQAAENVVRHGVSALLTGHCGPKAFRALSSAGIRLFTGVDGPVKSVVEKYKNGEYEPAVAPDVQGHW